MYQNKSKLNWMSKCKWFSWKETYLVSVIWNVLYPAINEDSLVKLCLPEPPTPTNKAWPLGVLITREILTRLVMASWRRNIKSIETKDFTIPWFTYLIFVNWILCCVEILSLGLKMFFTAFLTLWNHSYIQST